MVNIHNDAEVVSSDEKEVGMTCMVHFGRIYFEGKIVRVLQLR